MELGPAARIDRIGSAQIDQRLLETLRAHVAPPIHVAGMPAFERFEHLAILAQIHVVGNLGGVIDVHDVHGVLLVSVLARIASCSTVILRCERLSREPRRMFVWHFSFNNHPSMLAKPSPPRITAVFSPYTPVLSNFAFLPVP